MKKVIFIINDIEYLRNLYKEELTQEQFDDMMKDQKPFTAIYSLIGDDQPDRYELTDINNNRLDLNSLNGYQKGCILSDCHDYYMNKICNTSKKKLPCGVIKIKEESI